MELTLTRTTLDSNCTQGDLLVNGTFECFTLELPVKDGLPGSAIPPGKYLIALAGSPKFLSSTDVWVQRFAETIPHLLGIPNRTNILIHWGNDAKDTEGCILVGDSLAADFIGNSRKAFEELHAMLIGARRAGEAISITVVGGLPEVQPVHLNLEGDV